MNREELKERLDHERISEHAYCLDGNQRMTGEEYVLLQEADKTWAVFYSERGLRTGLLSFATESEACEYLLAELLSDPTTRKRT